ncbi:MAG: transposase [Candidatus Hydrogenedentes bacterium]|nr:transposase [Candidatus Hydrogenedentota bacterium]
MDRPRTTAFYRKHLPHWEVENGVYFITIRLHGTLPREVELELKRMAGEIARTDGKRKQALQRKIFLTMEKWLDASRENRFLGEPAVAAMVMASIRNLRERGIWNVVEYAIMPNHVHLFVQFTEGTLWRNMINFKRWTGRRAVRILEWGQGPFWEEEWFDHWARSERECVRIIEYIRRNPVKAGLVNDYREWPYGLWNEAKLLGE